MAVTIVVDGVEQYTTDSFSVTEDATPIDPSDMTGGVSQFTFGAQDSAESFDLYDKTVSLVDDAQGTTTGIVRGLNGNNGALTVTADSRMGMLTVERTAQPFVGTLENAIHYYLGLVGITSGIVIDGTIKDTPVVFPGWQGNVWDYMRQVCAALQVETSLVSDNVVVRPVRLRTAENYRDSSQAWAIDASNLAQTVEVYYYQNSHEENGLAYPPGGWTTDVQTENAIAAGDTATFTYPITASLSSIQQPVCVDFVDKDYSASSVYTVIGSDNKPVLAAEWVAEGGSVTVEIGPDTRSVVVTVKASNNPQYSPYTIAMTSGSSSNYSSLRIVGTGVFSDKRLLTLTNGVDASRISQEVGATVDNIFISTLEQAYHCGLWTQKRWGAPRITASVQTTGINRIGDTGSYRYPTIGSIDDFYAGKTIGDIDDLWAGTGKTIGDFDDYWKSTVADLFANQAFGNVAGARLPVKESILRIRSATITPGSVSYSADDDTTIGEVDAAWSGSTIGEQDQFWSGKTIGERDLRHLLGGTNA